MKLTYIDVRNGYKYGFPKIFDNPFGHTLQRWLVENGYPQKEIDAWGDDLPVKYWEEDAEKISKSKK